MQRKPREEIDVPSTSTDKPEEKPVYCHQIEGADKEKQNSAYTDADLKERWIDYRNNVSREQGQN